MFSITIIRLTAITHIFQNTEVHSIFLRGDIQREFTRLGVPTEDLDKVLSMKGGTMTIEHERNGMVWFIYLNKFN